MQCERTAERPPAAVRLPHSQNIPTAYAKTLKLLTERNDGVEDKPRTYKPIPAPTKVREEGVTGAPFSFFFFFFLFAALADPQMEAAVDRNTNKRNSGKRKQVMGLAAGLSVFILLTGLTIVCVRKGYL